MEEYYNFISNNPVLFILFFVILGFIIFNEYKTLTQKFKNITPQDAVFLINKDAFILDVRESSELNQGTIKDSKHINFSSVETSLDSIKKYSSKPTIVYCKSGVRSATISNILLKNNFNEVYSMKGGFEAWVSDNLPVVKS
ncbi:MAG: rhodanese-like domain-containing protein [Gammaproteobacteria bacterium]|jgi:rhodanese-related sulfurtransferase|nr:rhodanese-like domain-containing protein [Gammaproteobacteria bacterium]MBT6754443.1 rhodanese-like domain-containing protein [Gammaproteobacteria bacterium]MBT7523290.1 rhodanese-like domain-containing protein [Gammaproteobacteria bacterium]MDC3386346.1 rhodanese-like domain-containing protein [Gammaproteobacteria bacterium]|tara:strand:- start:38 stop:460 length:423 start_codon:yes stop_codon:yes gene_type:complete